MVGCRVSGAPNRRTALTLWNLGRPAPNPRAPTRILARPKQIAGMETILFDPLYEDVLPPTRATAGSAGYDLRAYLRARAVRISDTVAQSERQVTGGELFLAPGELALVPLGFRAALPEGWEAQIRPRSGLAFRSGLEIPNAPGTIDADYPDEWQVIVRNGGAGPLRIAHGERIAQLVLARFETAEFTRGEVGRTSDRTGGFGSTGR